MSPASSSSAITGDATKLQLNLQDMISDLFLVLTEKEREVIKRRFSLTGQTRQTLEKIGKHFNVTRERVRQIESIALGKLRRTVTTTKLDEVNQMAKGILRVNGGVMLEDSLIAAVLKRLPNASSLDGFALKLSLTVDSELEFNGRSITLKPFWRFTNLSLKDIQIIIDSVVKILRRRGSCMQESELISAVQAMNLFQDRKPSDELILSCLFVDSRLKKIEDGWGLTEWRFVRPRSIRDKVEIILKKENKPLHFVDIANKIKEAHFDHKNVTIQAVHNELIRYPQFVLVGRGLYALKEWGYEPGTVADVIERILAEKGPLTKKEIIAEVGKQRNVKVGTISLNLQKMPYFVRVGRAVYDFDAKKK
ncbi:MAG TPA: sigma factor-like helix-turn-helix DNA-binding protein [Candidatus Peribacterales bacterium]|nr:sigma factor-like helix-turn-helix DNA-binding protein [Candidatus Peribacterales bacterium]